jgi:hypothetical protein
VTRLSSTLRRMLRDFCEKQVHAEYGGLVGSVPAVASGPTPLDDDPFHPLARDLGWS